MLQQERDKILLKSMNNKFFIYLWCSMLFFILLSGSALAHKVTVFAWVEGGMVFGESKFSGGKKAHNAEIVVWDLTGSELLRTRTNEKGEFSFPVPKKCAMRIELLGGMGHKAEWTIPIEDIGEVASSENSASDKKTETAPSSQAEKPKGNEATVPFLTQAELESAIAKTVEKSVEKSLNKKITPLIKMMAELEQKEPSFSEIAGGIGYIFGLMGVALYFRSRQQNKG